MRLGFDLDSIGNGGTRSGAPCGVAAAKTAVDAFLKFFSKLCARLDRIGSILGLTSNGFCAHGWPSLKRSEVEHNTLPILSEPHDWAAALPQSPASALTHRRRFGGLQSSVVRIPPANLR